MARTSPLVYAFNAGETSPRLEGRVDLDFHRAACRVLENMIPLPQGPATRRPGTRFIAEVKDSAKRTALIGFEFSTVQTYMLEAGDLYFRFYRDKAQILSGGPPYEIASPYTLANLFDADGKLRLKFAQSADVMYLVHPLYAPRKLSRTGHTAWTLTLVDFIDGPYLDENASATTLTPSATSGNGITITASSAAGINKGQGFLTADTGRLVRIKHGATWGYAKITLVNSNVLVTADVKVPFGAATAVASWRLGLWSDSDGWPSAVTFHENRLFFGGAGANPQRIDASKSNDFENFAPGVADADPLAYAMASDQVNAIRWFASARDLLVGTLGAEARVGTDNADAPLTPTNVNVRFHTRHGCADLRPLPVSNAVLFVQRQGRKLRELSFLLEQDGYRAPDMTVRAEHVARKSKTIIDLAYQQEPFSTVWLVRKDGMLLSFTYQRDEQVTAWARHPAADGGVVEAVACIPGTSADETWLIVRRTVNGVTKRYVELIEEPLDDEDAQEDAFYVDCGLTYSGAATSTVTGLAHLEGKTVAIWTNKGLHRPLAVTGGQVVLDFAVTKAQIGLPYTWMLKPQRFEAGAVQGTAQGQRKRIDKVVVRLLRSAGIKIGRAGPSLDEIAPRTASDPIGAAPPLLGGDYELPFNGAYDTDGAVLLSGSDPTPVTVVCLIPRLATHEG